MDNSQILSCLRHNFNLHHAGKNGDHVGKDDGLVGKDGHHVGHDDEYVNILPRVARSS